MVNLNSLFLFAAFASVIFTTGVLIGYFGHYMFEGRLILRQNRGEGSVRKAITTNFKAPHYHLLNNLTLPDQDGTTQIDHVLVSTKGVFVIETKNYAGWIFGDEKSKQWTQVIYRVKSKFQNPIRQNFKHLKSDPEPIGLPPKRTNSLHRCFCG